MERPQFSLSPLRLSRKHLRHKAPQLLVYYYWHALHAVNPPDLPVYIFLYIIFPSLFRNTIYRSSSGALSAGAMVAPRKAAFAEESAEVEVLFANMEKLKSLTKKIQGSLNRLETSGKSVQDAIGPIYGNTQRLQTMNSSMQPRYSDGILANGISDVDRIIEAIDRVREPLDQRNREERIIRMGFVISYTLYFPDLA